MDVDTNHLADTLAAAAEHKGTSFVEVYQNCNIFNDGAFRDFTEKSVRDDRMLYLKDGEPMIFGAERDKGICLCGESPTGMLPKVVPISKDGRAEGGAKLITHNESSENPTIAYFLTQLKYPDFPVPVGVFRHVEKPTYEELVHGQIKDAGKNGTGTIDEFLSKGEVWEITQ